ncbi:MAG: S8 family serine peptidase [Ignavibacteria bacterium]
MSRRPIAVLLFLITSCAILPQSKTFFIKYKSSVDQQIIEQKISGKNIFQGNALFKPEKSNIAVEHLAGNLGKKDPVLSKIIKITLANQADADMLIQSSSSDPSIEYIEEARVYKIDSVPDDSLLSSQWALAKIDAYNAWNITAGDTSIIIGIIDTGIDFLHPDLKSKIYRNYNEVPGDNKDNDNNGFIDDFIGWDFTDRTGFPFDSTGGDYLNWDSLPEDDNGHGTYIAGIAGAENNNGIGISGAAPNVKLLNIRAFDPAGFGDEDDVAAGILYALEMGAKVINMSFGDNTFSYVLRDVIRYAYSQNIVLVASSGNSGSDLPHYPSGYSEVISVGNSTPEDYVSSNSNFGSTIDLAAPGTSIITTSKGGGYSEVSGTSASAPFVSAAAALILSLQDFTNDEVKEILKSTSDDIDESGWDEKSGGGRLNLFRAVSVIAPSIIKFNYPYQDFATNADSMAVSATILSAYFHKYELYVGTGLNPGSWNILVENGLNQVSNQNIFNLDLLSFKDSVYCLRLVLYQSNGRTSEERLNFFVNRTPPVLNLISAGPCYYGDKTTILAAVSADEPSVIKMFYRKAGALNFDFITLDGFSINNKFVGNLHYGFIPKQLVEQNKDYEVFFEAENLVGLRDTLKDGNNFFVFNTGFNFTPAAEYKQPFSLSPGNLFEKQLNLSESSREVAIREFSNSNTTYLYRLNGSSFIKIDSLTDKIIKDYGHFNDNGSPDLLTLFVKNGYIEELENEGFVQKFENSTGTFWPALADDIDKDGITEIIAVDSDSSMTIWKVQNNLSLTDSIRLLNYTPGRGLENRFDSPDAVILDSDNNGNNEIWMADVEGDVLSYEFVPGMGYRAFKTIETGMICSSAFLSAGDYEGDGKKEIAVLLHSIEERDLAPFYRLAVFNLINDSLNIVYEQTFIDASKEFNSSFLSSENAVKFADIDNDGSEELILFMFPYSYIFKNTSGNTSIISYKENINSGSILVSDLNFNGIKEIAFPANSGINFFEFNSSSKASAPFNLTGYNIDSTQIRLAWSGEGNMFYIYKGDNALNLILADSISANEYFDRNISIPNTYFYSVKASNPGKPEPLSDFSQIVKVYSHKPAEINKIESKNRNSVEISFTEKIKTTIENLNSFEVLNFSFPNSISPSNEYSYLVSFSGSLPAGLNHLRIINLKDLYNSPVKSDTVTFFVDSVSAVPEFFIANHQIINPYLIKVRFNLEVDEASASDPSNYNFEPENAVTNINIDLTDKKIVYLDLAGQKPVGSVGREYRLRIENLKSSSSSGNIEINSGAGSYILLTGSAQNLSGLYVYPSPVKINGGEGELTFANLPQKVKISIWTLTGMRVADLEGTNGSGGLQYNLKNENGELISSGIYLFRIVQMDDLNNEIDEKIGKFAVIK